MGNVLFGSVLKMLMDGQIVTDNVNVPRVLTDEYLPFGDNNSRDVLDYHSNKGRTERM